MIKTENPLFLIKLRVGGLFFTKNYLSTQKDIKWNLMIQSSVDALKLGEEGEEYEISIK